MTGRTLDWFLGFAGGLLLALMINCNSLLAKHSTPVFSSWMAHGIGAIASLFFIVVFSKVFVINKERKHQCINRAVWYYLGGIPGALTVVLSAITVNSSLGLSGALALMLVGQVLFGLVSDIFGLFGSRKRGFILTDFFVVLSVLTGTWLIIFFRS